MGKENKESVVINRRQFIEKIAVASAFAIVPRFVLGGKGYVSPSDMITLGFIGTGRRGIKLKELFLKTGSAKIVAACDVYEDKVITFKKEADEYYAENAGNSKYRGCELYKDFREILNNKDTDAVVISTPDHWHAVQAVRAAEAGKDIFCEKPLSLTVREGRAMVDATRKHQRVFQTGSMQRSSPEFRQAVELIRNGYIGDIKTVKVSIGGPPKDYNLNEEKIVEGLDWNSWLGPNFYQHFNSQLAPPLSADFWPKWRDYREFGGGDMTDWGAHMFDIVQWALDMDHTGPVVITPPDGGNTPFLTFKYRNGITVTHENFGKKNAVRFIGTEGQIDVQRKKLETTPSSLQHKVMASGEEHVYYSDNHFKDFLDAVRNRTTPICDVETGHRSATICNLGNIAYQLNRPLMWNPKKEKFKRDKEANSLLERPLRKEWMI